MALSVEGRLRQERGLRLIGRAVLRFRLYRGWSQHDLEARSGVDQTTISRLERGRQRGLSVRRLASIVGALAVDDVVFARHPNERQTELERMLSGDRWLKASRQADRLLGWSVASDTSSDRDVVLPAHMEEAG